MLPVMPHWHAGLRLTSSALVLWQLTALALGPVLLHYSSETTGVRSDRGGAACPVCDHQLTPGASCPMHSASTEGTTTGEGACALTSSHDPDTSLFTLIGSVGVPVPRVETNEPMPVVPVFALLAISNSGFSPLPSVPPPRA